MNPDLFHYVVITSVSGVLSLFLAIYAFARRNLFSSSTLFIWMSFFSVIYIFGHAFELTSKSLAESIIWLKVQYAGMPFISPLSMMLAMRFAGRDRIRQPKVYIPLLILPALTTLFVWTNEWHHLMYRDIYLRPDETQPLIDISPGPWYIVHGSYTFGCLLFGAMVLARYWMRTKARYWKQIFTMIAGLVIPMLASFLYLMGLSPHGMDPVPIVMCFTSGLYLLAILSMNLLIAPIARDRIFESMRDGVLVVDLANRLIDYNSAAQSLLPALHASFTGKPIEDAWNKEVLGRIPTFDSAETEWTHAHNNRYHSLRTMPVQDDKGLQIGNAIVIIEITKQKLLENRLTQLAYTDGLTQIANRSHFLERSEEAVNLALISGGDPLSVLLFDIDFFKRINDQYGHAAGDEAIRHVVATAQRCLGPGAIFGRYGGEEFVVCLPGSSVSDGFQVADRIRLAIEAAPLEFEMQSLFITASFGVASLSRRTQTMEMLLKKADEALYEAKEAGRNQVHVYQEEEAALC